MSEDITVIGQTNFRGQKRAFGIYPDDRRRHVYVVGKTGVGKSTLLENMIMQDISAGKGVGLVDPHGDIAERLLDAVPPGRINDVVYFDPSDVNYPIAFNVLEAVDPTYKYLVASGLVSSLKKIWADSWGPRLEYILRNTILALLDYPSSTMLGIMRMLADKDYRKKVVMKIEDPVIKAFWVNEFSNYNERFRSEAISPIQNKVGQFLSSAIIRNIVAQPKSTIDMQDIMDNGKILLINVSKGKIGEDNSALLGAMLITKIQLAAMDRAKIPEEQRRDFYLYVDEFQNFATESFATILSEARKYRLNLTIAHQYITQMEEEVRDAVFGNVGTMVTFRVGAFDAEYLEKEFEPHFMQTDLVNLAKYNAYIKLMINGMTSKPFSMQTIAPVTHRFDKAEAVRKVSRERYSHPREAVEEKIARWSGVAFQGAAQQQGDLPERASRPEPVREGELAEVVIRPKDEIRDLASALRQDGGQRERRERRSHQSGGQADRPPRQMFPTVCSRCGKETEVPFEPRPGQPVYCRDCLAIVRATSTGRQAEPRKAPPVMEPRGEESAKKTASTTSAPGAFSGPKPPSL